MSAHLADPEVSERTEKTDRIELIRALGAIALTPPPSSDRLCEAVGLASIAPADHTEAFVLLLPPHAAIYLGPDGQLGGEGLDRVEGFWRALGLRPPADADHLGVLLMAYADLLEQTAPFAERVDASAELSNGLRMAPTEARTDPAARAAATVFHEHLWPFAPGYLVALSRLGLPEVSAWADLVLALLRDERHRHPAPPSLPLALREAPGPIEVGIGFDDLLDAVVTPVRIGMVLTQRDLAAGAAEVGLGYRRGERRYALKAMVEQDKPATLSWLARLAHRAAGRDMAHTGAAGGDETERWWTRRATHSADVLDTLAAQAETSREPSEHRLAPHDPAPHDAAR
ncbi:TorA maturation chaperone TorD [Friedmanniella endophytica]|uniref:TorA maturation chaperone TorD n=1 Tax=Microlunatus kandeliicorticis TaxID=1759536 RepID=A0A7W3P4G8_9ACTN|nr:molecular chaperone TorD family protein [Microlunatus kandeliicorticis]MBA8792898.1 TorA maturation chaperone TorD [Microlunatus kandeliicorticis]